MYQYVLERPTGNSHSIPFLLPPTNTKGNAYEALRKDIECGGKKYRTGS